MAAYNRAQRSFDKRVVIFAIPAAWRCDGEKSTVTTADGRLEPCTICTNIARTPQALSINKTEHTVPAQGHVAMCETSTFVGAPYGGLTMQRWLLLLLLALMGCAQPRVNNPCWIIHCEDVALVPQIRTTP